MSSITLPRDIQNIDLFDQNSNNINGKEINNITVGSYPSDNYGCYFQQSTTNQLMKSTRTLSYNEEKIQLQSNTNTNKNNSSLKHLCTRFIRRFSINKEYRTRSEDMSRGLSTRFNNYQSFSSSTDDSYNDFEWPDFEKLYDSIPSCLVNTLSGLDDISIEEKDDNNDSTHTINSIINETNEQSNLFENCERGKCFRRNAICHKLDKSQYHRQLDTFIQQLMIEKLMRTWT
ncbi:unnamed protein product [Rotaria sordida]|uniref:Uncharacterized protein n=1 Tax=Rotaria sordida TaxID=392033 RepID=A0A814VKD5_9BILA|nr:unnamed protein product [Rotaria sordida]